LQQGFSSRSRWLLQILGLTEVKELVFDISVWSAKRSIR